MIKVKVTGWIILFAIVFGSMFLNLTYHSESLTATIPEIRSSSISCASSRHIEKKPEIKKAKTINLGKFRITAYCPCYKCCGKWANSRPLDKNGKKIVYTSSGRLAKANWTISVDPRVIPYGKTVLIDGKKYSADDCGGAIKGKRIDMYFASHKDALKYGAQYKEVYLIVEDGVID